MNKFLTSILTIAFLSGCASVNSVSLTPIPAERKSPVRVQNEKMIFLGFNFDNDFVDRTVEDLRRQCPQGKVTGLLTKDENINYFLYFVWKKQITVSGYCVPVKTAQNNKTAGRSTASEVETAEDLGL